MSVGNKNKTWKFISWILALVLITPVLVMLVSGIESSGELFSHLWQTVLPSYISNTLLLSVFVVAFSLLFGVPAAAIISQTNVLGKKYLRWLLMLPLAMPAYLVAYLYTDLLDYAGPVQRFLRASFGWNSPLDYWFFDIRTLLGASIMIALVLFPYVYMLVRTAFECQDQHLIRASRSLGYSLTQSFIRVSLPLARPAIAVSASLVLMETLADFATVQYFAVNTLTTAIYDTWLEYGDLSTANAIASILMLFILFAVVAEQRARAGQRHQSNRLNNQIHAKRLTFFQQVLAVSFCWLLVIAGFILPFLLLVIMAIDYATLAQLNELMSSGFNSLQVAFYTASIATIIAILLALFKRLHSSAWRQYPIQISGFGYAIPGTVLAMAMLATLGPIDHWLNDVAKVFAFQAPGLILSGSIIAIIFALVVRFAAIANGTITSGVEQIPASLDFAPASLGVKLKQSMPKVHLPLLKSSILVAWLLVFVEAMKELPAVLLLRPFNFETLSTQIYQLISDERLEQGALGALLIVLFGLLPIVYLNKKESNA